MTMSERAGLVFPVKKLSTFVRSQGYSKRRGKTGSVHMAGSMQHLAEILVETAWDCAAAAKCDRIRPKDVQRALEIDSDLAALASVLGVRVCGGGVARTPKPRSVTKAEIKAKKSKRKAERKAVALLAAAAAAVVAKSKTKAAKAAKAARAVPAKRTVPSLSPAVEGDDDGDEEEEEENGDAEMSE